MHACLPARVSKALMRFELLCYFCPEQAGAIGSKFPLPGWFPLLGGGSCRQLEMTKIWHRRRREQREEIGTFSLNKTRGLCVDFVAKEGSDRG